MKHFALSAAIILLLFATRPAMAAPPTQTSAPACEFEYTVQTGDSLSLVAEKYYGDVLNFGPIFAAANALPDDAYPNIADANLIQPGMTLCIPATNSQSTTADLSPQVLENLTYLSSWTQDGTAPLVNGEYREPAAPGSATETVITLDQRTFVTGPVDGHQSVPVLLVVDPGGSGTFTDLALVSDVDGQAVNVATTTLGDRIQVIDHQIADNAVEVNLLTHAPDAPMAAPPTEQVIRRYALQGSELVLADEQTLGSYPGVYQSPLTLDTVTFNAQELAQSVEGQEVPASPYNPCCAPVPTGAPDHLAYSFDGQPRLFIYPVEEWAAQWATAGNDTISGTVAALDTLLAEQPPAPAAPLPMLPPPGGVNDVAAQVSYLNFEGGSGVRYLGRFPQAVAPALANDFRYVFQGLTGDGSTLISFSMPVTSSAFVTDVNQIPAAELAAVEQDYDAYRQSVADTLNAQTPADFAPDLARLDALAQSISIQLVQAADQPAGPPALIDSVTVEPRGNGYVAVINGSHRDACGKIGGISQSVSGSTVNITVSLAPPEAGMMCAQVITPFTEEVPLDVSGVPAGEVTVNVNGLTTNFTP